MGGSVYRGERRHRRGQHRPGGAWIGPTAPNRCASWAVSPIARLRWCAAGGFLPSAETTGLDWLPDLNRITGPRRKVGRYQVRSVRRAARDARQGERSGANRHLTALLAEWVRGRAGGPRGDPGGARRGPRRRLLAAAVAPAARPRGRDRDRGQRARDHEL